jgi:hypothetical protein
MERISDSNNSSGRQPGSAELKAMIRRGVGPRLDSLAEATKEVKESRRLLELARWAGDTEAEAALSQALGALQAASA